MSYMFGTTRKRVTAKVAQRLNAICIEQGGTGFVGPVDIPGNELHGWFEGPNHGEPFDSALARAVLTQVEREGIEL